MEKINTLLLLVGLCLVSSCGIEKQVVGLWQIEKVSAGDREMTPMGRWTRLNPDHTQESGNGWMQHSVGKWHLDADKKEIRIISTNGLKDEYGGFAMKMADGKMIWQRAEEDQTIEVVLKKINKIPTAPANKLLGAWKLKTNSEKEEANAYLYIRWDRILVGKKEDQKRKYATYKTHGHKQELQIIYYEDPLRLETWTYDFNGTDRLSLSREEEGKKKDLVYERINDFPN